MARPSEGEVSKAGPREAARHIASTAARLFAERGYDATSVREIVEAAGVTKPTLYYHFGSKEGLAQALLTNPLTALTKELDRISGETEDPVEALVRILDAQFEFCVEDPDRGRFFFALLFGPLGSELANELSRFKEGSGDCMAGVGRRLVEAGIVMESRLGAFVVACKGILIASTLAYLYHGQELEPGLASRLVRDLLQGFGEQGWRNRGDGQ